MFTFPKATTRSVWSGQGDIWGEDGLLPYLGGNSLGLCFGMSALWIKNGAPANAPQMVLANKKKILRTQALLQENSGAGEKNMLLFTAQDAGLTLIREREYGEPASYVILDLLIERDTHHHLLSFYFTTAEGQSAHAIGISFDSPTDGGSIFDPNYGVATYSKRSILCDDLHQMLATYCTHGHLTKVYLQSVENPDAFGAFA
jgi:hypothetical protein